MNDNRGSDNQELDELKRSPGALRLYTSRLKFQKAGNEMKARCPFHSEATASFTLFQKDGLWLFKCFGCSQSGNVIQFVQDLEHISFKDAIRKVKQELGSSWEAQKDQVDRVFQPLALSSEPLANSQEPKATYKTYSLAEYQAFERKLAENPHAQAWLQKERGISYATAKQLHLGYRQEIKSSIPELQDVLAGGWIVFPSIEPTSDGDRVVLMKYRSIARKAFARQPGMETVLCGVESIDPLDDLYVVEGEFDRCVLEQAGFRSVSIPSASTNLTPQMKDQLMQAGRIILAGDNDNGVGAEKMEKLWKELQERTFLLKWAPGVKDANQEWLTHKGDEKAFKRAVETLTTEAVSQPMSGIYDLATAMLASGRTNLSDHPKRLRFPWPSVDKMAILLPGSVMSIMATNTKQGKTCFVVNFTLDDAMKHDEVVLNYQCELSTDELANMVASYLLKKSRNSLGKQDYQAASSVLTGRNVRYYVGRNPTLNTVQPVLDLIEAGIRRLGATIVVLDHIHFICRNEDNEIQAQANAMQRIKRMAQQYQVKFIVVGQPRKAMQANKGKVVHITDMKGSESLMSDADACFALHRDYIKVKDPNNPPMDDYEPRTELHLLAARAKGDGPTFAVLQFHGELAAFHEELTNSIAEEGAFGE